MRWIGRRSVGASWPNRRRRKSGWGRSGGLTCARESPKTRKAFAAKLEQMIDMLAAQIPELPRKAARKQAMAVIATLMGTLVLARIAGNGEFSDEILGAGRDAVLDRAAAKK